MTETLVAAAGNRPLRRFYELDSLRGLAAATVVLHHFNHFVPERVSSWIDHSPFKVLVAGRPAVMLFFVLSGFVLTLPYLRNSALDYPSFMLKRICRIYLPYLAALALAILADFYSPAFISSNAWVNATWTKPITASSILQHILFIGSYDHATYNTAFWSLIQEMRISLLFPFIALAVLRWPLFRSILLALALWATSNWLYLTLLRHHLAEDKADDLHGTLFFAGFFIMGALLARHLDQVQAWFDRLSPAAIGLCALAAIACYGFSDRLAGIRHLPAGSYEYCVAFGALGFIVLAIHCGPIQRFLTSRAIHHLGKISYSLYLIHATVLFALVHTIYGKVPLLALLALYLSLTLLITEAFYRLIERPTMRLGRSISSRSSAALPIPAREATT